MKKLLTILTAACMMAACVPACAEGAEIREKSLELFGSSVRFPALSGMEDAELEQQVNDRIAADLDEEYYQARMTQLISDDERSITVSWEGAILGDVFSCALEAEGAVRGNRGTHEWAWSNVDLRDGHEISFGELFADEDAAREAIGEYLEWTVGPELSPHLGNSELTPLPEGFRLERTGLTLLYKAEKLSTLRDRAGAVKIGWNEIRDYADWSEDGILSRIGAAEMTTLTEESRDRIIAMTEGGQLPDIPVKPGDSVKEWTDRSHLLNDPEEYAGGRMFSLEGAAFRNVFVLSDKVSSSWDESVVQGVRMDRGCVWGLCIGETAADEWHQLLGEPDHTTVLDAEQAELERTVPGKCDYYQYGDYRLQLQYGEDGILAGITLAQ